MGNEGAVIHATGAVTTTPGAISTSNYQATSTYRGKIMNYSYFAARLGLIASSPATINNLSTPPNGPGDEFYYTNTSGVVNGLWHIKNGEKYVIFVNGDLKINTDIVVDPGGFLMFIVKGDINVSHTVNDVQGLYVADGNLNTETNATTDNPLTFEGSMVAWGAVNLGRNLKAFNITTPGETFIYRPDLILNMPNNVKTFAMQWREVVPGTFGN